MTATYSSKLCQERSPWPWRRSQRATAARCPSSARRRGSGRPMEFNMRSRLGNTPGLALPSQPFKDTPLVVTAPRAATSTKSWYSMPARRCRSHDDRVLHGANAAEVHGQVDARLFRFALHYPPPRSQGNTGPSTQARAFAVHRIDHAGQARPHAAGHASFHGHLAEHAGRIRHAGTIFMGAPGRGRPRSRRARPPATRDRRQGPLPRAA